MPRSSGVIALVLALAVALAAASAAAAENGHGLGPNEPVRPNTDVKIKGPKNKKDVPGVADAAPAATGVSATTDTTPLGTVRSYVLVNYVTDGLFASAFTLKGVGEHSEVWVQNNTRFPTGDCRNDDASRLAVTQEQIDYFVNEFDANIYPKESATFSVAPPHDGTHSPYAGVFGNPNYFVGDGTRTVILVMNIRDSNYADLNNAHGLGYIVGVHHGTVSDAADRNIITIDSYDWKHRIGPTPPNEPVPGNACTSAPAKPFLIEGTFAHEYQHLLERYASPGEEKWVNEGISDFAMELTGYNKPWARPGDPAAEGHVLCFEGWLGKTIAGVPLGGPENSLTWWEDQGEAEGICDYGAAWTFMEFLAGKYGNSFLGALHNEDLNGLAGLQAVLDRFLTGRRAVDLIHEWAVAVALDDVLDSTSLRGVARDISYSSDRLGASINWDNDESYSSPGAPPNGSDYVRLRDGAGAFVGAKGVSSLAFAGSQTLPPTPVEWTVVDGALAAGAADEMDRAIVRQVAVGAGALSFRTRWNLEEEWDFAFVQISTDGGATYKTVPCADSRSDLVPEGYPAIRPNLPGLTGTQDWKTETCDLSAYAGRTVLLAFRAMTDWGTLGNGGAIPAGWSVDDVTLDGTLVSDGSSLAGWKTFTEIRPEAVAGWTVQLVGYRTDGLTPAVVATVPLDASFAGTLDRGALQRLIGDQADVVGAIVTYDEPTEQVRKYARYTLRVNGVLQPGG